MRHGPAKGKHRACYWQGHCADSGRSYATPPRWHLGATVAVGRVFLYRAAVPASVIDRESDASDGHVAEWLRSGLQNRLPRFNSGRGLQASLPGVSGKP